MQGPRSFLLNIVFLLPGIVFAQTRLHYEPARIDAGYLYVYHGSGNPAAFVPTRTIYLYLSTNNTFQLADVRQLPQGGELVIEDVVMNWDYFTAETDETQTFLSSDFRPQQGWSTEIHRRVENDFTSMVQKFETDTILGDSIETLHTPSHRAGTTQLDKNQLPRFSMDGFPSEFFLAARFLNLNQVSSLKISFNGFSLGLDIVPGPPEVLSYEGNSYQCRKYELVPTGAIGTLFGKKGFLWLDEMSGYAFMVKSRDENDPFRECILAERQPMSERGWSKLKSDLMAGLRK